MRYRTFIAVDVDRFSRDRLAGVQEQLAGVGDGVRWVEPRNMHLTLLFLGEVNDREIPAVCRVVGDACKNLSPFVFTVSGLGAFPNLRRPRTLIARVGEGSAELSALHSALERPLLELGCYRREERAFTPHVTLGRVKRDGGGDELATGLAKFDAWQGGQSRVREVKVYSSETTSDGPEYAILSRHKLGSA